MIENNKLIHHGICDWEINSKELSNYLGTVEEHMLVNRIHGVDRYKTNLEVLKKFNTPDTVIIVNGENFPDAISATPLAKKYKAPLMLVNKELTGEQQSYIYHGGIKKAIIVGGTSVVSKSMRVH
ncbi:cell wall-binding repeat-containing protein [Clostridium sp. Marseille-Q2269]|uniref:cell wall-binding repeat-containing protein n=1 Tax=Clostridium sp. Marseille-Q2269 TaxID=2942205 RepID=UPI0020747601|nr:cell wall-binding repeat-containing protein [Clostridium sp. Marseille-Q2269]